MKVQSLFFVSLASSRSGYDKCPAGADAAVTDCKIMGIPSTRDRLAPISLLAPWLEFFENTCTRKHIPRVCKRWHGNVDAPECLGTAKRRK